jgi:hypothetical protein
MYGYCVTEEQEVVMIDLTRLHLMCQQKSFHIVKGVRCFSIIANDNSWQGFYHMTEIDMLRAIEEIHIIWRAKIQTSYYFNTYQFH